MRDLFERLRVPYAQTNASALGRQLMHRGG
jgi:hypothetical protein